MDDCPSSKAQVGKGSDGDYLKSLICVSGLVKNIAELAPNLTLENLKEEELDEEAFESKREMAELEPFRVCLKKNECCLWTNVGNWVGSPGSIQEGYLVLEQILAKRT